MKFLEFANLAAEETEEGEMEGREPGADPGSAMAASQGAAGEEVSERNYIKET